MTETTSDQDEQTQQQSDSKKRYEHIGAKLRRRREALSLDQGDVARHLHLPGMVVNDIETGQVEQFSSLYRRGYIRNYARFLELDPEALLAEAGEDVPPQLQRVLPETRRGWNLDRYLKFATYALVTVAIVPPLVYFFVAGGTRLLERDSATAEPTTEAMQPTAAGERSAVALGSDDMDGRETAESSPAPHVSASALPLHPVRPSREAQTEPTSEAEDSVALAADAGIDAGPPLSALQLELLEDSWIEIHDAEGTRLEYDLLRDGQTRNYEGQAPFRLLLGRSSAVKLVVNGQTVTWEGHDSGDVAELDVSANGEVQR